MLVDAPGVFSFFWRVISPVLRENTRAKLRITSSCELLPLPSAEGEEVAGGGLLSRLVSDGRASGSLT